MYFERMLFVLSSVSKELKEFLTRLQPDDLGSKRIRDSSILLGVGVGPDDP